VEAIAIGGKSGLSLVERILSQTSPKHVPKRGFWDTFGTNLGPIGTCMGTIWDKIFWDLQISWRVWVCFGTNLGLGWD
jgi:hypothetical protein